jgi:excisionase family DNA binding protein
MLLTVRETAEYLRVSCATVYGLVRKSRLKCYRVGAGRGVIRISLKSIAAFLEQSEPDAAAEATKRIPRPRLKHIKL